MRSNIWETYSELSKRTGLTEIQLHKLRIAKIVRSAVIGRCSRIPVLHGGDVDDWILRSNFTPNPR
ncbi:MAG: hypothetical protein J6U49_07045 [Alistipes sp.]|nr:hypothetical protein [Alistipes sp.]